MNIHPALQPSLLALLLAAAPAIAAPAADYKAAGAHDMKAGKGMAVMHNPESLKWGDGPSVLPKGVQLAVLEGDPHKSGPYVIRLKMPVGYKIPPHWHSKAENLTIISGTLALGMGDKMDTKTTQTLKTGGYHSIAAQAHHYAFSPNGAVVQIHGDGPFDITYVNPADNPDPSARK